jgi:methionine salvage enolase-phosphatase E1
MYLNGDTVARQISLQNIDMSQHTVYFDGHIVSSITYDDKFHSIVVKRQNGNRYDSYVFYDKNAKIEDLYQAYLHVLDMKNYKEGFLCIHEQSDTHQTDYMNDIIHRVNVLYRNETFYEDVPIILDLDDDMFEWIKTISDERNMTIDEFITETILSEIKKLEEE